MEMPISLHILSGHGYNLERSRDVRQIPDFDRGIEQERTSVNRKLVQVMDALYDLIFAGVLERFPKLRIVLAENEIGWLPFVLEQWDYYFHRHGTHRSNLRITIPPSEYFHRQVYATFFNDAVGARALSWWGENNCMWSSDYPHGNTTWPNSSEIVSRDMGDLPSEVRAKLVRENAARLYTIDVGSTAATTG
jgi:predicted TIM-barrel fold metal-dependent hydrolase